MRKGIYRSHQPATNRKKEARERNTCRLVIVELGIRLRRTRNTGIKKNQ
jgi:hypothetical protein